MVSIPSDVSSWMKNSWLKYLFPNFIHIFKFTSTSTQHLHVLWLATNIRATNILPSSMQGYGSCMQKYDKLEAYISTAVAGLSPSILLV